MRTLRARKRIAWLLITAALLLVAAILLLVAAPGISVLGNQGETGAQIRLQYASFDPLVGEPASLAGQTLQASPDGASMSLVQFSGPVLAEWKEAVQAGGVRLYDYIPEHAFIARLDAQSAAWLRSLPFVRWVGDYYPAYRMPAALSQADAADPTPLEVEILALPDADLAALGAQVGALGGSVQSQSASEFSSYLRLTIPAGQAGSLAALDGVVWVQPRAEMGLFNDVGGEIMSVTNLRTKLGLYGSGQIVAVADTGLDVGVTTSAMSDDFEGRIVAGQAICAGLGGRDTWSDLHGHGTHVSGSVLGNGKLSDSDPAAHDYTGSFAGVAPEARIFFQAIGDTNNSLCIPVNLKDDLFKLAYDAGARIHSNSWGSTVGYSQYDSQAAQVDQTAWTYKNLLLIFAAGNHGIDNNLDGLVDYGSMASPGTAKNTLSVGATENNRPSFSQTWGDVWAAFYPAEPIASDYLADEIQGMAAFSSRGPTDDGRIKPDIVAPGTFILSTRSHDPLVNPSVVYWDIYDTDYAYLGGTSMSTPLTAGGAALVREWLTESRGQSNPSAALMKAVLLNGAADISPGQYTSPQEIPAQRPNNVSGWGRADLQSSLNPAAPRQVWLVDNTSGLATGGKATYTLKVGNTQALGSEIPAVDLPAEASFAVEASTPLEAAPPAETLSFAQSTPQPPGLAPRQVELALHSTGGGTTSQLTSPAVPAADVNLVLDDGSYETSLGLVDELIPPTTSYQFIWLNRFTPDPAVFPFNLDQIQVLFDGSADVPLGGVIDLAVYQDADGDPANGATLLRTIHETVKENDGVTWSVYDLATPVAISGPGDVLIAVINRYVNDGISPPSYPASIDEDSDQLRSWIGWWAAEPPDPPVLQEIDSLELIGNLTTGGNWLIRGYGSSASAATPTPSPTPSPTPGTPIPTPVTGGPLRLTLVWTDYPGAPAAADVLVNDLDLEVVAPDGKHYYGNFGLYTAGHCLRQVSATVKWDACNNAEGVYIPTAPYGTYTVYVHGYEVPNGPQPFAVVASGDYLLTSGLNKKVYLPMMRKLK